MWVDAGQQMGKGVVTSSEVKLVVKKGLDRKNLIEERK
jgi:hypothetical protein